MSKTPIPPALRWEVWNRDGFKCRQCGSSQYLSIDHIIPEIAGGETKRENLQTLCQHCNSSKGSRTSPSPAKVIPRDDLTLPSHLKAGDCLGVKVAADEIGIHKTTLYRWVYAKKTTYIIFGNTIFIPTLETARLKNKQTAYA